MKNKDIVTSQLVTISISGFQGQVFGDACCR